MANTVKRAELYRLVWATPMSRLASEFGVSDVALAKTCKRWDIPRPGRGYWAQLEAGQEIERPLLSESPSHEQVVILRSATPPPPRPRMVAPDVPLPKNLTQTTDAVRDLGKKLGTATRDSCGRLIVGAIEDPVLAVTVATHRRALALLEPRRTHAAEWSSSIVVAVLRQSCPSLLSPRLRGIFFMAAGLSSRREIRADNVHRCRTIAQSVRAPSVSTR